MVSLLHLTLRLLYDLFYLFTAYSFKCEVVIIILYLSCSLAFSPVTVLCLYLNKYTLKLVWLIISPGSGFGKCPECAALFVRRSGLQMCNVGMCVATCMNHNQGAELVLRLSRDLSVREDGGGWSA